jgi:hypothetical protein
MGWSTLYLGLGIVAGVMGIWNLARQRNVFLSLAGILWFLVVLFEQYIPKAYALHLIAGIPSVGTLMLYAIIPIFVILSFFTQGRR